MPLEEPGRVCGTRRRLKVLTMKKKLVESPVKSFLNRLGVCRRDMEFVERIRSKASPKNWWMGRRYSAGEPERAATLKLANAWLEGKDPMQKAANRGRKG